MIASKQIHICTYTYLIDYSIFLSWQLASPHTLMHVFNYKGAVAVGRKNKSTTYKTLTIYHLQENRCCWIRGVHYNCIVNYHHFYSFLYLQGCISSCHQRHLPRKTRKEDNRIICYLFLATLRQWRIISTMEISGWYLRGVVSNTKINRNWHEHKCFVNVVNMHNMYFIL